MVIVRAKRSGKLSGRDFRPGAILCFPDPIARALLAENEVESIDEGESAALRRSAGLTGREGYTEGFVIDAGPIAVR